MYLHPSADLVILLAHDPGTGNGSVVLVRHPSRYILEEQERIPVPGYILESRMVGNILYVVSRHSREERIMEPGTDIVHVTWRSGLAVTKIDLSNPDKPSVEPALMLDSEAYNYWGAQVQATPRALLISTNAYDSVRRQALSTVHVVDISDPDTPPSVTHHLPVAGQVRNKFNMHLRDGILTVVSQVWRGGTARRTYASVETFDLNSPAGSGSAPLGSIEFAQNESITATRFVGDLCYVVTFLRIDPLFVVSLADPANPRLLGELEIPGFSTYLEPLGEDALISVGVEDSRIAVSWFDVSDPENPAMTSRVYVGAPDGWTWTEANWDEKAFGFFPEQGLILLPFQGSDPDRGRITGVQVIEMADGELIKRGAFENEFQARRARALDSAIASISGRSLRTLDISDPDHPEILADLFLAWPADLVHRTGDWLVQMDRGGAYWSSTGQQARLHIGPVSDPETLTTSLDLGPGRVVGTLPAGDCLWVAQSMVDTKPEGDEFLRTESFTVTAVDLSDPSQPVIAGRDVWTNEGKGYSSFANQDLVGALLPDGSLCWYPTRQNSFFFYRDVIIGIPMMRDSLMPYYYGGPGRVFTVDILDKTNPRILAAVDLQEENQWGEGNYRLLGATLYYGCQNSEQIPHPDKETSEWHQHHWLKQLDLSEPAAPVKRDPLKLPGTFEHAFATPGGGVVLFTSVTESSYVENVWTTEYRVQALAFDGLAAYLLDELVVPGGAYGARLFDDSRIVLAQTRYDTDGAQTDLTIHEWLATGSFQTVQTLRRPGAVHTLSESDDLLIAAESDGLTFIEFTDPADPDPASVTVTGIQFWGDLDSIDIYQREFAYVPLGMRGVEPVDLRGVFAPRLGRGSEGPDPASDPEWVTIDLMALPQTNAGDALLVGALDNDSGWMVTSATTHISYDSWIRGALGLAPDAPAPAPGEDSDRDGLSNAWEYHTGSHPGLATSTARPQAFLAIDPDGDRYLEVRIFINPHAPGMLLPEVSTDGIDWLPGEEVEFVGEPFSPSVTARLPARGSGPPVQLLRFSFH
jgi:hypothetical protein